MTVLNKPVIGIQTPRLEVVPACYSNAAPEAIELLGAYGLVLDPWQELVLEAWLGENEEGNWSSASNGLSVPRQNGKGSLLEAREVYGAVILGERILHTAHLLKTSKDHFRRILAIVESNEDLDRLVKKVVRTNGEEAIEFKNGGAIKFVARSKNSGRGFSTDLLVCDEAQDMSDDDYAALQPTLFTAKNPQTILTGTPPIPSVDGTVWTRFRALGTAGEAEDFTWLEWSADKDDDFLEVATWLKANPALGIRAELATVRSEFTMMDEETFCRERLGMWADLTGSGMFDMTAWGELGSEVGMSDPVAFAIDVSPQGTASISVAGYVGTAWRVEVVEHRKGTGWIVGALKKLQENFKPVAIVVDPYGLAGGILPDLDAAGIRTMQVGSSEVVRACGAFYNAYENGNLMHGSQPSLDAAIQGASKRPVGNTGAWAWNRKNSNTDISPLVSVTLAAHGLTTKRKPKGERTEQSRRALLLN